MLGMLLIPLPGPRDREVYHLPRQWLGQTVHQAISLLIIIIISMRMA
jgi:hypothetical protein